MIKQIVPGILLLQAATWAAAPSGHVEIDPEMRGVLVTDWGYDIKNASAIDGLTASKAQELFVDDRMSILRVAIWGGDDRPAHPAPGEIDVSYYVYDGIPNSKKMFTAMKNTRDARPDVLFFTSKKSSAGAMPTWTKSGGSLISTNYARMLADYLRFWEHDLTRKDESFVFDVLGINNEGVAFSKAEYAKHKEVIDELRILSQQAGTVDLVDTTHATDITVTVPAAFTMPEILIGPERWNPEPGEVADLLAIPGAGETLDLIGTHYYPQRRYYNSMAQMLVNGEGRPGWNSEVHWDNQSGLNDLEDAESAIVTVFDNIDAGFSGYCWWAYTRSGFKGGLEQALTTSTTLSRSCAIDDEDGFASPEPTGSLVTRAFREGSSLRVWALNVTGATHPDHAFDLLRGEVTGDVTYKRWAEEGGSFVSSSGVATLDDVNTFSATLPTNSITLFTLPYRVPEAVAVYLFDGDVLDASGNGNHGSPTGGISYVEGRDLQCLEFNGMDSSVTIPRNISNEFTIAFWMRTDTAGMTNSPAQWWNGSGLVDGDVAGGTGDFGVSLHGGNVAFGVGQPDTTLFSETAMADGQWRHVAATRNSVTGEMELFINGISEARTNGPTGTKAAPPALRIGCLQTGFNHFDGELDEVQVFDRVLEQSEIQDLAFFDTSELIVETWESAAPGAWVGTGSVQADNVWTFNGRNRTDWGISSLGPPLNSKALGLATAGTHNSSCDAETPLPRTVDPTEFEWVTLKARFVFNALTTSGSTDTRAYAVDNARQNGYGIMARSETDSQAPVLLRVFSAGSTSTVSVGQVGSQEIGVVYDVTASFRRMSDNFTQVRYRVLKEGLDWQAGDVVIGRAAQAGSLLEKLECSNQKNSFCHIDDLSVSIHPDLRDLYIGQFKFQPLETNLVMMVDVPMLGLPYHIETATNGMLFSAELGTTFTPDVSPWQVTLPFDPVSEPVRFFRISEGEAP